MAEPPVINASPLIFLSRGGFLDLLQLLGEEVLVPSTVAVEIQQRGVEDPTVAALSQTNWLTVVEAPPTTEIIQSWDLGKGESSVLTWAYTHPGTEAIMDDLAARRCAAVLGIPVRGTLVPQGGSQKSKVKSQKYYGIGFLGFLNGCSIYAVTY